MDFELDRPQKQIQKAVKDFVRGKFKKEVVQELTENQTFPAELLKEAAELGFIGIDFPEQYEGEGFGLFEKVLVAEALCCGDSSVGACLVKANVGAEIIRRHGSEKQKFAWLPHIAEGSMLFCKAYTEPGIGNDLEHITTTAKKKGDVWVVSGKKSYVMNAGPRAGVYVVLCRTENGLSTLLVEADREGIEVKDIGKRVGARLMNIATVEFNAVQVPAENLIGKEDAGLTQVMAGQDEAMVVSAAQSVGFAQGAFDRSFSHVKQREQFSQKIIEFQVTQQKIAEMSTQIAAARLMTFQAALSFKKGVGDRKLCAMAKYFAAKAALYVCDEAIQMFGGYGYVEEYEVERFFRDAKANDIFEGTQIFQKQAIADNLLKRK